MWKNQRGQSTAEYAILIAVVIAAVVGMQLYVKRGLQAKLKGGADAYTAVGPDIGGNAGAVGITIGTQAQYEPYYTAAGVMVTNANNTEHSNLALGGTLTKTGINNATIRNGVQAQGTDTAADTPWNADFRN